MQGKLNIKGATLRGKVNGTVTVSGKGSVLNLENCKIENDVRCLNVIKGGECVIGEGCELHTTTDKDVTVFMYSYDADGTKLTVNGEVTNGGENYAISGNGTDTKPVELVINEGAVVKSAIDSAIYMPSDMRVTVNGGLIEGGDAVYQKCGKLTINGGKLHGFGNAEYKYSSNGSNNMGYAAVVEFTDYPAGMPELTVRGGELLADNKEVAVGCFISPKLENADLEALKAQYVRL